MILYFVGIIFSILFFLGLYVWLLVWIAKRINLPIWAVVLVGVCPFGITQLITFGFFCCALANYKIRKVQPTTYNPQMAYINYKWHI